MADVIRYYDLDSLTIELSDSLDVVILRMSTDAYLDSSSLVVLNLGLKYP